MSMFFFFFGMHIIPLVPTATEMSTWLNLKHVDHFSNQLLACSCSCPCSCNFLVSFGTKATWWWKKKRGVLVFGHLVLLTLLCRRCVSSVLCVSRCVSVLQQVSPSAACSRLSSRVWVSRTDQTWHTDWPHCSFLEGGGTGSVSVTRGAESFSLFTSRAAAFFSWYGCSSVQHSGRWLAQSEWKQIQRLVETHKQHTGRFNEFKTPKLTLKAPRSPH